VDEARANKALSECAIGAEVETDTEHDAIENGLLALADAMHAGASPDVLTKIMDMVVELCKAHFQSEELALLDNVDADMDLHARDHKRLLKELRAARTAIREGQIDASIVGWVLLDCFHKHAASFDRIAHKQLRQQRVEVGDRTLRQAILLDRITRTSAAAVR
jgi:hemerythrin